MHHPFPKIPGPTVHRQAYGITPRKFCLQSGPSALLILLASSYGQSTSLDLAMLGPAVEPRPRIPRTKAESASSITFDRRTIQHGEIPVGLRVFRGRSLLHSR